MKDRDKLRKLYPDCWVKNNGYRFGRVTYTVFSNGVALGVGNTAKNAYANALQNCGS